MTDTFRVGAVAMGHQVAMADIATAPLPGVAGEAVRCERFGVGAGCLEEIRLRAVELQRNGQRYPARRVEAAMVIVHFKSQEVHRKCALSSLSHSSAVPCSRRSSVFVSNCMDSIS